MEKSLTGIVQGKIIEHTEKNKEFNLKSKAEVEAKPWFSYDIYFKLLV